MAKKIIAFTTLVVLLALIVISYFVINYKIESVYHTKISVDKIESSKIYISPNDAYKFKIDDLVHFNFDGQLFSGSIKSLSYDAEVKAYYAEIYCKDLNLIPGSIADIYLITDSTNVLKAIMGSV